MVQQMNSPEKEEDNPLMFWVAYLPGEEDKKNYLSDGSGNLRIFKSEILIREYLDNNIKTLMSPDMYDSIVVHSVQGEIVVPDEGGVVTTPAMEYVPVSAPLIVSTLATQTAPPNATEMLDSLLKRRNHRRRPGKN